VSEKWYPCYECAHENTKKEIRKKNLNLNLKTKKCFQKWVRNTLGLHMHV
jgi:hypothetical protein